VNLVMHSEAAIEPVGRCTCRSRSCELGGCNRVSLDILLDAVIGSTSRCTSRLGCSMVGDALRDHDRVISENNLARITGRHGVSR